MSTPTITQGINIKKGIQLNAPPPDIIGTATRLIDDAVRSLPPDHNNAFILIGSEKGVNAAVVFKVGDGFQVASWIGKDWGSSITGGVVVKASW